MHVDGRVAVHSPRDTVLGRLLCWSVTVDGRHEWCDTGQVTGDGWADAAPASHKLVLQDLAKAIRTMVAQVPARALDTTVGQSSAACALLHAAQAAGLAVRP